MPVPEMAVQMTSCSPSAVSKSNLAMYAFPIFLPSRSVSDTSSDMESNGLENLVIKYVFCPLAQPSENLYPRIVHESTASMKESSVKSQFMAFFRFRKTADFPPGKVYLWMPHLGVAVSSTLMP